MSDAHKNFAYSTVLTAPSPATSGVSLVLQSGDGAKMPATPFNATVWPTGAQPTTANAEIVTVTGVATDTLTIVRQAEGTAARSIVVGDQFAATITQQTLNETEGPITTSYDRQVQPGFTTYICDEVEIASGKNFELGAGSVLEIG